MLANKVDLPALKGGFAYGVGSHAAGVAGWAAESDVEVMGVAGGVLDEGRAAAHRVLDRLLQLGTGDGEREGGAA